MNWMLEAAIAATAYFGLVWIVANICHFNDRDVKRLDLGNPYARLEKGARK